MSSALSWQRGGAKLRKAISNRAAGALIGDGVDSMISSDQQHFMVACAFKQIAETQTVVSKSDSDQIYARAISSRSIDGDADGMLDRFDIVYIITGKPVLDLELDKVLCLLK